MQGNDQVIKHLNKILSNELRAINQYFLHSRMLSDWGLVTTVIDESLDIAPLNQIKVISYKEKSNWSLETKYNIGKKVTTDSDNANTKV